MKTHIASQKKWTDYDDWGEMVYWCNIPVCKAQRKDDVPEMTGNLDEVNCGQCLRRINADRKRVEKSSCITTPEAVQ